MVQEVGFEPTAVPHLNFDKKDKMITGVLTGLGIFALTTCCFLYLVDMEFIRAQ